MNLILNLLAPADKILQQRSTSLVEGYDVINSTITMIRKLITSFKNTAKASTTSAKCQFHRDSEDVITEHIGIHNESESLNLKPSYFEIIDIIQSEFTTGFRALSPASNYFLDKEELQPHCFLVNSTTESVSEDLLDAETTMKSIVSSTWCAFE